MSDTRAATVAGWWPWLALPVAASSLVTLGLSFDLVSDDGWVTGEAWFNVPGAVGFAVVAAGIWATRPHPAGLVRLAVLYTVVAVAAALVLPAYGWTVLDLPGARLTAWLSSWVWALGGAPLLGLGLLLYPDGRLPGPRWWPAAALGLAGTSSLVLANAFAPGPLGNHPEHPNPVGLPGPALWSSLAAVGFPLVMAAAVLGLAGLVVKFRSSAPGSDLRGQVGGFALAGLLIVVAASVPAEGSAQTLLALAGGTALPATVGYAVLRHRLLDQRAELAGLQHRVSDLAGSRRSIVSEREEERARLRRELHDGLGPSLAAIGLGLRRLEREDPTVRDLAEEVQRAVTEVRRLCDGLSPAVLGDLGLVGALTESCDALGRVGPRGGLSVDALPHLPPAVEVAAYRIAMEAVTNAVRHSSATSVRVTLSEDEAGLVVRVADDGCGLATGRPAAAGGLGLGTMRSRAEELEGRLHVEGGERGTTVTAWLPVGASRG